MAGRQSRRQSGPSKPTMAGLAALARGRGRRQGEWVAGTGPAMTVMEELDHNCCHFASSTMQIVNLSDKCEAIGDFPLAGRDVISLGEHLSLFSPGQRGYPR